MHGAAKTLLSRAQHLEIRLSPGQGVRKLILLLLAADKAVLIKAWSDVQGIQFDCSDSCHLAGVLPRVPKVSQRSM